MMKNKIEKAIEIVQSITKIRWGGGTPSGKKTEDGQDIITFPYPIYPDGLIESIYELGIDPDYLENWEKGCKDIPVEKMDTAQLKTYFTWMVRGERFCDGLIAEEIESGKAIKALERYRELTE